MRLHPPRDPVTLELDGDPIEASFGEPIAVALVGAGLLALSRSPKFHRPRGPACFRGGCEGCLARVDGEPNVMTCLAAARAGTKVETQNVVGSREVDLLRVTDWFFADGMNHHELMAGVPGLGRVMQAFARRVAGIGRLPDAAQAPRPAKRREVDALVVGAGPAGMAVAARLAARGRRVEVVDDQLRRGGSACALPDARFGAVVRAYDTLVAQGVVEHRAATVAGGVFGDDVLLAGPGGAEIVTAGTLVLATGAHDGVLAFEGNDVPGVMSARAAGTCLEHGVVPGKRIAVVVAEGGGPFGDAYAEALARHADVRRAGIEVELLRGEPTLVRGSSRVKGAVVRVKGRTKEVPCDALVVCAPRSPAYELCAQAGAEVRHEPRGFVVRTGAEGRIRVGVFACGEVRGTPLDRAAIERDADAVADAACA